MLRVGRQQPQCTDKTLYGFHVPPFNSVDHLHMHCLTPPFHGWRKWKYLPGTVYFVTADEVIARLES